MINSKRVVFINGSNQSGKSKLGHMLAYHEGFIHNYITLSYNEYFSEKDYIIKKSKLKKLRKDLERVFHIMSNGKNKFGARPLGKDKIKNLNIKFIKNYILKRINLNLSISNFYLIQANALILGAKNKEKIRYIIFEVEDFNNSAIQEHLKKKLNAYFFNIYRNTLDQIYSLKINVLFRGAENPNFYGALSGKKNIFCEWLESMVTQKKMLKKNKLSLPVLLSDLKPINLKTARKITNHLNIENKIGFINFLYSASKMKNYMNKNIEYKRKTQSWENYEKQKLFDLDEIITKKNLRKYIYDYEFNFYYLIHKKLNESKKNKILFFDLKIFKILVYSLIFGFKDIRKNKIFIKKIYCRLNAFLTVYKTLILIRKF